jgi:hypothetical protein
MLLCFSNIQSCIETHSAAMQTANQPEFAIVATYRSRCSKCHVLVEPGTHERQELRLAFARHHKRVKLTDEQWAEMIELLARKVE